MEISISISISSTMLLWRLYGSTDFFENTCFKENGNMAVEKITVKASSYHMKQVASVTYTLQKTNFAAATFEGL